jgi:glycine hydroxymethyltransferase
MDFNSALIDQDKDIFEIIEKEKRRQFDNVELIASENYTSRAVLEAQGSILTNKYAEGYPGKRFYDGCEFVDEIENIAIERLKKIFKCRFANVQPHSGSQANQAVFLSFLQPGDVILGMSLDSGGHLTHGAAPNLSGKWFKTVHYGVRKDNFLIDYDEVRKLALENRPKLIICGYSAYPRQLDFKKFREIADEVGAYLLADIAHIAGLVAADSHPSPFPHAHIVTSTTHKTLRGPRGGIILSDDEEIAKKINSSVFPGIQGGPLMHIIAGKAVAFGEALTQDYKTYINNVVSNASNFAKKIMENGYDILTGGTENHLLLVDLRSRKLTGKQASTSLDRAGITCNKNAIPFDTTSPFITSGIRLGTPACTSRAFGKNEFEYVADLLCKILDEQDNPNLAKIEADVKSEIVELCRKFPIYSNI